MGQSEPKNQSSLSLHYKADTPTPAMGRLAGKQSSDEQRRSGSGSCTVRTTHPHIENDIDHLHARIQALRR